MTFQPSSESIQRFRRLANGTGLTWLLHWLGKTLYNEAGAKAILAEAVEGGLLATFQHFKVGSQASWALNAGGAEEVYLNYLIGLRIPRVDEEEKEALCCRLRVELTQWLQRSPLVVESAMVYLDKMRIVSVPIH